MQTSGPKHSVVKHRFHKKMRISELIVNKNFIELTEYQPARRASRKVIVSTDGSMARLVAVAPRSFVKLQQILSKTVSMDPRKRARYAQQARIVQALVKQSGIDRLAG
jgi:hypothetical protein